MADFVYEDMLAWRKAHVRESTESGQVSDGILRVFWTVPIAAKEGARDWLKANRSSIVGTSSYPITIDGANYEDTYRLVRADYGEIKAKTVELVATYGLDHDTALDWTNARVDEGFERQPADEWIRVRFPSINFSNLKTIRDSVRGITYTDPVINGDTFTGTYKVLATTIRWDEGQSTGDLFITMGDPEHRITSFRDIGVPSQREITYIWNVPDAEVQALVDSYKNIDGTTVGVSRPTDIPGTANLVVTIPGLEPEDLDFFFGSQSDTDTFVVYKWNLTKAQLKTFADEYQLNEPGVTKSVQASYNSSTGRWNATAIVAKLELNKEQVKIEDVGVSGHISRTHHYKWNLEAENLKAFADDFPKEQLKADGKSVRFAYSKHPGGDVYDATAIIEDVDDLEEKIVIKTPSSEEITEYRLEVDEDEKDLIINNLPGDELQDGARSFSLQRKQNGNYDIIIKTRKSVRAEKTFSWTTGTVNHQIDFYFGLTQVDAFGLITGLPNDGKTSYSVSLGRGGDGYYGLTIRRDIDSGSALTATFGNSGVKQDYEFHWGLSEAEAREELVSLGLDGTRIAKRINLRRNTRDGTIDLTIILVERLQENLQNYAQIGTNYSIFQEKGFNYPTSQMPSVTNEPGRAESISYSRDGDGNINYVKQTLNKTPWESETYKNHNHAKRVTQVWHFSGHTEVPQPTTTYGNVDAQFDPASGTYSGKVIELIFEYDGSSAGGSDSWNDYVSPTAIVHQVRKHMERGGKQYFKDILIRYFVCLTRSREIAERFVTTGQIVAGVTSPGNGGVGSTISSWAGNKFMATWVDPDFDGSGTGSSSGEDNNMAYKAGWTEKNSKT